MSCCILAQSLACQARPPDKALSWKDSTYSCRKGCLPTAAASGLLLLPTDRLSREEPVRDVVRRVEGAAIRGGKPAGSRRSEEG